MRRDAEEIELRNEFAAVRIAVDDDGNGPRLKVTDVETGAVAFFDPVLLQSLTWASDYAMERVMIEARSGVAALL